MEKIEIERGGRNERKNRKWKTRGNEKNESVRKTKRQKKNDRIRKISKKERNMMKTKRK